MWRRRTPPGMIDRMRPSRVAATILAAGALGTVADAATAPSLRLSPTVARRGDRVAISGRHWGNHKLVSLYVGRPNSEATALISKVATNNVGRFAGTVPVKRSATPGDYVVLACRKSCAIKVARKLTILP